MSTRKKSTKELRLVPEKLPVIQAQLYPKALITPSHEAQGKKVAGGGGVKGKGKGRSPTPNAAASALATKGGRGGHF